MAKPPSKRRGITLGPRANVDASLELLNSGPPASVPPTSGQARPGAETAGDDPGAAREAIPEQLVELRRMSTDLETRWKRQTERLQEHLEQQRDQIARQTRRLQALEQSRQRSGRLGILLALLALSVIAAVSFHTWPRLQHVAGDLNRVSAGVGQFSPQLRDMQGQVDSLTSGLGQLGGAMETLRRDLTAMRSDLGSLRQTLDTLPADKGAVQADAGGRRSTAYILPPNATTMSNPYRPMRPMMPW